MWARVALHRRHVCERRLRLIGPLSPNGNARGCRRSASAPAKPAPRLAFRYMARILDKPAPGLQGTRSRMRIARSEFRWGILAVTALVAACGSGGEESDAPQTGSILSPPSSNHAPTISGAPGTTIAAGAAYKFIPTASDGDGDALIFGIDAKPTWASFDTATGALTGT